MSYRIPGKSPDNQCVAWLCQDAAECLRLARQALVYSDFPRADFYLQAAAYYVEEARRENKKAFEQ